MIREALLDLRSWWEKSAKDDKTEKQLHFHSLWRHFKKGVKEHNPLALKAYKKMVASAEASYSDHPAFFAAMHNIPELIEFFAPWSEEDKSLLYTEEECSPLHYAIALEHKEVLLALLSAGFPSNLKDRHGQRPIDIAISDEKKDIIKFIADKLFWACRRKEIRIAIDLIHLAEGVLPILDTEDMHGNSPLIIASRDNLIEVVECLLEGGASLRHINSMGENALSRAIFHEREKILKELLEHKKASSMINEELGDHSTYLMRAIRRGSINIIEYLLHKGASLDHVNAFGGTALSEALYKNDHKIIKMLLNHKDISSIINVIHARRDRDYIDGVFHESPLMIACARCDLEIVKELLAKGASLKYINRWGRTALYESLWDERTTKVLLDQEGIATIINAKYSDRTPLKDLFSRRKMIDLSLNFVHALTRSGTFFPDDFSLLDIRDFPIFYTVFLEYFKPIFQVSKVDMEHNYSKEDLVHMKGELCETFRLATPQEKLLILAHIESKDLISTLIRDGGSDQIVLNPWTPYNRVDLRQPSADELVTYHHRGYINLIDIFPIGIITLNQNIIDACLSIVGRIPDETLMRQDFPITHAAALSSQCAHSMNSTRIRQMRCAESIKKIFDTLAKQKPSLIENLINKTDKLSDKQAIAYTSPDHPESHRLFYQAGADPLRGEDSFLKTLIREENIHSLLILLESYHPRSKPSHALTSPLESRTSFKMEDLAFAAGMGPMLSFLEQPSFNLNALRFSSSALIRLLFQIQRRESEKREDSLLRRITEYFKVSEFIAKEGHAFPVQTYTIQDIIKLHQEGKIELQSLLPDLFKDYDEKLFNACYQQEIIGFFREGLSSHSLFHDIEDERYLALLCDHLKEEVNKIYHSDNAPLYKYETYQLFGAILHTFLFTESDDMPSPARIYEKEQPALFKSIQSLYSRKEEHLTLKSFQEERELFNDFKRRYTERHPARCYPSRAHHRHNVNVLRVTSDHLPSRSEVCASSSATPSQHEPKPSKVSEAAKAQSVMR